MIYLPIAELPINIILLLGLGGLGGILAGMFGIGGGFLLSPLLIFMGVPPAVAVATSTNQIIASSVSGFLAHWYRHNVDIKMGLYMLFGGIIGAVSGVSIFTFLQRLGQIDLVISIIYVVFLGFIGSLMAVDSLKDMWAQKKAGGAPVSPKRRGRLAKRMPLKVHFPRSDITISMLMPIAIGLVAGILVSLMGIGGGFVTIPAMIYLLGMPTSVVVGTSLFQIIFVTSLVTVLHSVNTQSVDIVLAFILIIGGVIGAQIGTVLGLKLPAEKLRILLAVIVLGVCLKLGISLFSTPENPFIVERVYTK